MNFFIDFFLFIRSVSTRGPCRPCSPCQLAKLLGLLSVPRTPRWFKHSYWYRYSKCLNCLGHNEGLPKSVNNLFKFSDQDSDLEYLFWRSKNPPVSSDLKPPLVYLRAESTFNFTICIRACI